MPRAGQALLTLAVLAWVTACHEKAPLNARVESPPKVAAKPAPSPQPRPTPVPAASTPLMAAADPSPAAAPEQDLVGERRKFPEVEPWCQARRAEAYEHPSECTERILDAWVKRLSKPASADGDSQGSLVLDIPALKLAIEIGANFTPLRCDGRAFPELAHTTYVCSVSGETSMHTDLCSTRDALVVRHRTYGYFNPGTVREDRVELPCGTRLRFHSVKIRDTSWSGFGSACERACYDAFDRCEDGCYRRHADGWGKLSPAGDSCLERCNGAVFACSQSCS